MSDISEKVKNAVHHRTDQTNQLLECVIRQNEDLIALQSDKADLLEGLVQVTNKSFRMYRIKNFWSGVFGIVGLILTIISTALMAVGIMYLPDETKALFNEILTLMGL